MSSKQQAINGEKPGVAFWAKLEQDLDPAAYRPQRNAKVVVERLEGGEESYYILKEPETRSYLRLSEEDYALWWQMDGRKSVKDILFYSLKRFKRLPIGQFNSLVADLRDGHFLKDTPTGIYTQIEQALAERDPVNRIGSRILNAFLHTEIKVSGLDDFFTGLYRLLQGFYTWPAQLFLLLVVLLGSAFFGYIVWQASFALVNNVSSLIGLLVGNILVITIHELAHGLTTKHYGREIYQGGVIIYWGMPALFVDTRDIWLSPRKERVFVSWAGPYSGLIIGGTIGLILGAVIIYFPALATNIWATFLYQLGFLAYLTVFFNINPLLELDLYFILMDWVNLPALRERAISFWRHDLRRRLREQKTFGPFWGSLSRSERIFTLYGGLTLVYLGFSLFLVIYFWQTRFSPFVGRLWQDYGFGGQLLVLVGTAVLIIPAVYYLLQFGWSRIQAGLEWLARRELLFHPVVLALLIGLPLLTLLIGLPRLLLAVSTQAYADMWLNLTLWLLNLSAIAAFVGVARQFPGSRFQWAMWSLVAAPVGMTLAWISQTAAATSIWRDASLLIAAGGILAAGIVAWNTVRPERLETSDRLVIAAVFALGVLTEVGMALLGRPFSWTASLFVISVFIGLILMTPLWLNFMRSRFALPWVLLGLAMLALPWLYRHPSLHLTVMGLWLYAGALYLSLNILTRFPVAVVSTEEPRILSEREQLISAFNHFMQAMFTSYETIFGGRQLAAIQMQIQALGPINPDDRIPSIAQRCHRALLLAVDRLDDLSGTLFTQQVGQSAYDSLPWLEAEALARHVLSEMAWGAELAQGFIIARDRRTQLIRQAKIFAGFDQHNIKELLEIVYPWKAREEMILARAGDDATHFFLIEWGEVGVIHDGLQVATLETGGYFGANALLEAGDYQFTYRALTPVNALIVEREQFTPLLRANTALARHMRSGADVRELLKKMPLFNSLAPQQLEGIGARLQRKQMKAGNVIVRQGQSNSFLFIVFKGEIEVVNPIGKEEEIVSILGPGEHFGEYALFADTPFSATYRAKTDTSLLLLDKAKFDELVASQKQMAHYVEQIGSGRLLTLQKQQSLDDISDDESLETMENRFLRNVALFQTLDEEQREGIAQYFQHRHVTAGEIVVHQDQARSHFFVVFSGKVECLAQQAGREHCLAKLGASSYFGDYALFANISYPATYRAITDTKLWLLDESRFDQFVVENDEIAYLVNQGLEWEIATKRFRNVIKDAPQCRTLNKIAAWARGVDWLGEAEEDRFDLPGINMLKRLRQVALEAVIVTESASNLNRNAAIGRAIKQLNEIINDASSYSRLTKVSSLPVGKPMVANDASEAKPVDLGILPILEDIAIQWRDVLSIKAGELGHIAIMEPVFNPFIVGPPVQGKVFVGREEIFRQLEGLWGSDPNHGVTSVVLYGHRRMGKTSILENLGLRFGTKTIVAKLNMQRAGDVRTNELLYYFASGIYHALREASLTGVGEPNEANYTNNGFAAFNNFLWDTKQLMAKRRVILAIDEFELIEDAIQKGSVKSELLEFLRGIIHTEPWLILALAGLHTLKEMTADYWNPLFASVKTIRVSYLSRNATAQLLANPTDDFLLDFTNDAIDRVYELVHGQPQLTQLIGRSLVERFNAALFESNDPPESRFVPADIDALVYSKSFYEEGNDYFTGVWQQIKKSKIPGQITMMQALSYFDQPPTSETLIATADLSDSVGKAGLEGLLRHEMIRQTSNGHVHFAVPLMGYWIRQFRQTL